MKRTKKILLAILANLTAGFCALGVACGETESSSSQNTGSEPTSSESTGGESGKDTTDESVDLQGLEFHLQRDGTYGVRAVKGSERLEIIFPATYQGKKVSVVLGDFYGEGNLKTQKVIISDGIEKIADYAFKNWSSLISITIPDSVTSIGQQAFNGCSSVTSIIIPSSVTSIGGSAFAHCDSLTIYCEATSQPSGWKSSWNLCLHSPLSSFDCPVVWDYKNNDVASDGFIYVVVDNLRYGIKDGAATVVWQASNVQTANIPASITYKGTTYNVNSIDYGAFANCDSLTSVVIPDSVTSIGDLAFSYCYSLTSVVIPDSVTNIGEYAFYRCKSLTSVVIGDGVTSIGDDAFAGCDSLTSIEIPDSVTSIGDLAFSYCYSLTSVVIPDSVTSIGSYAFRDCGSLTIYCKAASMPSGWSSYWNYSTLPVVWDCHNNDVASDGYIYVVIDNLRYGIKDGVATVVRQASNMQTANIPARISYKGAAYNVTSIGNSAFYNCDSLTSVVIPDSVTSIGEGAFSGGNSLTIYCEEANKPSGWDSNWNDSDRPVVWNYGGENGVTDDGFVWGLLRDNTVAIAGYKGTATGVIIPSTINGNTVSSIVENTFAYCSGFTNVIIPDGVTSIGKHAFKECSSLTSVVIGNSVTSIGSSAFYNCDSLTSVVIGNSVTSIGDRAFFYCSSLTSIEIPDSVTSIDYGVFNGCSSLTIYCEAVSQPSCWNSSWNSSRPVVWDCKNNDVASDGYIYVVIDNIRYGIKDGVATVVRQASNIQTANIPASITYKGASYSVTSIDSSAFSSYYRLTSVVIPDSVTSIGGSAFSYCLSLTSITFEGTKEQWNEIEKDSWSYNSEITKVVCKDGEIIL